MSSTEYLGCNIETFENTFNNNSQKGCHGKIMVNGISVIRYHLNTTNHRLKRLFNGYTTQIHSPCGQVKIYQRAVDIFLADLDHFSSPGYLEQT